MTEKPEEKTTETIIQIINKTTQKNGLWKIEKTD